MKFISESQHAELAELCRPDNYRRDATSCAKYSKDYYWYSPRLTPILDQRHAEAVVHIYELKTLQALVAYCAANGIPITPRGAGTGNYGQAAPVLGGILVDLAPLMEPFDFDASSGRLRVASGVRCQTIEEYVRPHGWEMPMYPSTWVKSTIGGFIAGGSAGIGSIRNGVLRDGKMVTAMTILDGHTTPQLHKLSGEECLPYLHAYGVNGLIVELELQMVPKLPWEQVVFSGPDLEKVFGFAVELAHDESLRLRLLNFQQWPIPSFFIPLRKHYADGEHLLQIEVTTEDLKKLRKLAEAAGLTERLHLPHREPRRAPMLSDFVQNHSTLWAKKEDPAYTYCAGRIDLDRWQEQLKALDAVEEPKFSLRCDFNRTGGKVSVGVGPLFRAPDVATLRKAEAALTELGMYNYDVHSPFLNRRGMEAMHGFKTALKDDRDPHNILSRGKLAEEAPELAALLGKD
jgi:FAD/FMN-containing dehydrogenase